MSTAFYGNRVSPNISKTPQGFLVAHRVPIARTGWQKYRASEIGAPGDGVVRVYRSPEEVFHPATLASFEGMIVTDKHPPQFIAPDNVGGYFRGHVQNVRRSNEPLESGDEVLLADLLIMDAGLVSKVEMGTVREISCGYDCDYEPLATGDYAQKNIRGNHIAVVPSGRAGESVRINDSDEGETMEGLISQRISDALVALGWKKPTADAESEAVLRNAAAAEEAEKRNKMRNRDAEEEKRKKEEAEDADHPKGCKCENCKEGAMDSAPKLRKLVADTVTAVLDARDKAKDEEEEEKKKAKDAEEKKEKEKEESEDADLIAVETMTGEEVPKNPIPGADAALSILRGMKSKVAATRDRKLMNDYNSAVNILKGRKLAVDAGDGYQAILDAVKPEAVRNAESMSRVNTGDKKPGNVGADFEATARQYRGKDIQTVARTRREAAGKAVN